MLGPPKIDLGFADAENYRRRENRELLNTVFVKNRFLEDLLKPSTFFLIGEKGTGKTAYAVFMANNYYGQTKAVLKYVRETEYDKFVSLKSTKNLVLSDYRTIWRVIVLLLLAKSIEKSNLEWQFSKTIKYNALMNAVDDFYQQAFSPEIQTVMNFVEGSNVAVELISKHLKLGGGETVRTSINSTKFQTELLYIEEQLKSALKGLKLKTNLMLFIDGIDVRPGEIPFNEYLDCVKGLGNAIWDLNNDFFPSIRDSVGRFRIVLLARPDIFTSINLQNLTNKVTDNSVYLDWRTTYAEYRSSPLFELCDKILAVQQELIGPVGTVWDHYFPWKVWTNRGGGNNDPSFVDFLRKSYSRPRDHLTMMQLLQRHYIATGSTSPTFTKRQFNSDDFRRNLSQYLMGGIRDQLSFYYTDYDYAMFLKFFTFLGGSSRFSYDTYMTAYENFRKYVADNHQETPAFIETSDSFIQFLYDTNIVSYVEHTDTQNFFHWCYRERGPANISPKVMFKCDYQVHSGLQRILNLGNQPRA